MRILIVKLSSLGDIIHTLPALHNLKMAYPQAQIDWVTEEVGRELLLGHPYLNRIIVYQRYSWPEKLKRGMWIKVIKEFRSFKNQLQKSVCPGARYHMVFDFQGLLKSALVTFLAKGKEKIGFANGHECSHFVLTKKFRANYNQHAVIRYLKLVNMAGVPVDFDHIVFPLPAEISSNLKIEPPYIIINPIGRWESKMWFQEKWRALAKRLSSLGYKIVFTGTKKDRNYIIRICQGVDKVINLAGKTSLNTLISLYKKAKLAISIDTGTLHLAVAAGTPVIALFGPTAPWRTGPFGKNHTVIYKSLPCQPCFKKRCVTKECLKKIEIEEVVEAVRKYQ